MNQAEAQIIAEGEIPESPYECVILEDETIAKEWGWVFFYQTKAFVESGDFRDMLGGNAPIIVNRVTGDVTITGTAHDIEYYINEYEQSL